MEAFAELWKLREASLDFIGVVRKEMLSHDAVLINFPLEAIERLLKLLDPCRPPGGVIDQRVRCDECGLAGGDCNAWVVARGAAERYLRSIGYSGLAARETAAELVPDVRKEVASRG
jgi:hypothetical protein